MFLLVLIELFSLGVTAEALRAKIDKNICAKSVHRYILQRRRRQMIISLFYVTMLVLHAKLYAAFRR